MPNTPTLEQVLAAGNVVPADGTIEGPNGSTVTFMADGGISVMTSGGSEAFVGADGRAFLNGAAGGRVTVYEDGTIEAGSAGGADIALKANGEVQITSSQGTYQQSFLMGSDGIQFSTGPGGLFLDLPFSDPRNVGRLWNDNGTVKVSAG